MKIQYGYKQHPNIAGSLVIHEQEQQVLKLLAELRETGLSLQQIKNELKKRGVDIYEK